MSKYFQHMIKKLTSRNNSARFFSITTSVDMSIGAAFSRLDTTVRMVRPIPASQVLDRASCDPNQSCLMFASDHLRNSFFSMPLPVATLRALSKRVLSKSRLGRLVETDSTSGVRIASFVGSARP